ncbi:MAG: type II toxin-antitoxin system RelE/ParE family toxin [Acidobacteria bacterium]|nr:type II toxin-antitoxin system RelE/ParE family toxin [Acidobacteriota bacterium]
MFEVAETHEFRRLLAQFPAADRRRLEQKLASYVYPILRVNPLSGPNIKRLVGFSPATWRYRVGEFRVFFEVHDNLVIITAVHRRRDAY